MAAAEATAQLTRRTVVGSFIFRDISTRSGLPPRVALFRRSSKVNTYPHKLAPISGTVESSDASPVQAAWREIREETRLTNRSLRLRRQGKPYTFVDEALKREWTIYPLLFEYRFANTMGYGREITTDWEHESWDWYDPREVTDEESFGGVPNLLKSLRRSWFEYDLGDGPGGVLARGLEELQRDHASGAAPLSTKALGVLADVMVALDGEKEGWWRNVRMAAWHLVKNGRWSMGAGILNAVMRFLGEVEEKILPKFETLPRWKREDRIYHMVSRLTTGKQPHCRSNDISRAFCEFLEKHCERERPVRILTLSNSSTLEKCISDAIHFSGFTFDVRVLESRPLFEGVTMADSIKADMEGLAGAEGPDDNSVTVYTEAQTAVAAQGIDLVMLGADIIEADGSVCNKVGSLPAVLSARYVAPKAKVMVVSEKSKVWHYERPEAEECHRSEVTELWNYRNEVTSSWYQGVEPRTEDEAEKTSREEAAGEKAEGKEAEGEEEESEEESEEAEVVDVDEARRRRLALRRERLMQYRARKAEERETKEREAQEKADAIERHFKQRMADAMVVGRDLGRGEARNYYFEWVEGDMVDYWMTEEGLMDREALRKLAGEVEEKEKHLFGDI